MELEKEIRNNRFESNFNKVVVNIIYTYGWVNNCLKSGLDKYNLTHQQYNVLRILRGQRPNPATVNLIKERMLDKMSDASRIVDRLVAKELVVRKVCEQDRRAVDITISDKGLELLDKICLDEMTRDIISKNLTEEEAGLLSDLLDKLRG
ncbi:regulatory protein MarR [Pseudopedobacter saltans DSM 12145]|uniref:Regulatory protein MarR n=1 Tax=Pseudopedobacter saltans (strain ATCC 51119 / DSM 12145 / JCM 21818 / CCUG 39354 / LMG 10337 / NBRC 100064 / NCIMB 13643) TaxID=762903 RepID=F0SAL0_PSESL|nr:MarR family transcriptional regulator [Pseudopedobacter saltans]ADY52630.1 regulatory protein MarR [Pseudopedobacter saltans DSM 12145]